MVGRKKIYGAVVAVALNGFAMQTVAADLVEIPQVPADAKPVNGGDEQITPLAGEGKSRDYQTDVLSNPTISAPARASAVIDDNGFDGGNTAVITQTGKSNKSSVTQQGNDNYANQSQKGTSNDLRVEQHGDGNRSDEQHIGKYNHKVKIQNGETQEDSTTTIEQAPATQGSKSIDTP